MINAAFKAAIVAAFFAAPAMADYAPDGWRVEAAKAIQDEEQKVIETYWSQPVSFWVTMKDDGTRRDGFAEYLCMSLTDYGRPEGEFVAITIWEAFERSGAGLHQLGKANCE